MRGKRGRGARRKVSVIGLLKRNGRVYTHVLEDCSQAALEAVITGRVAIDSVIHTDGWKGYDGLIDLGYQRHFRIRHDADQFPRSTFYLTSKKSSSALTIDTIISTSYSSSPAAKGPLSYLDP